MDLSNDIDVMARTLYGEADARNRTDAIAIAWVIKNRCKLPNWPNSISKVCLQAWQFSCWNQNDPQRERIIAVSHNRWFTECLDIAESVVNGRIPDPTNRATHYYATYISKPKWARGHDPVYEVAHKRGSKHLFFNDIDTKPPKSAKEALDQEYPLTSTGTVKAATVGAAGVSAVGALAETTDQLSPALSFITIMSEYGVWAIVAVLLAVIAFMLWRRYDDRREGLR